ncbi:response regulator [Jannaschia sp. S6380]|uniref:response regulator n=1 Tax=Jannaschia sp. S6380 TaxID=2926408 RepID=UPI001FF2044D|nr:response regulator [Jannaschia sp. S6380]MCK0166483.1 response regulator [Jannaschia sp. S6380]
MGERKLEDDRPLRVLVVEDEGLIALDLEMQVEGAGHRVVGIAVDIAECRAQAMALRPDVALMDFRLRNGDTGADAGLMLRREFDVPCIFVSGNLDTVTRNVLTALDPVAFVGKPVLPSEIRDALGCAALRLRGGD